MLFARKVVLSMERCNVRKIGQKRLLRRQSDMVIFVMLAANSDKSI